MQRSVPVAGVGIARQQESLIVTPVIEQPLLDQDFHLVPSGRAHISTGVQGACCADAWNIMKLLLPFATAGVLQCFGVAGMNG